MTPADAPGLRDFMAGAEPEAGSVAYAGAPLAEGCGVASREAVIDALRTVCDPEIPVNIYDLGLIYRLEVKDSNRVEMDMTLTAPSCPVAPQVMSEAKEKLMSVPGVEQVDIKFVWDPLWNPDMMTDAAKDELGWTG